MPICFAYGSNMLPARLAARCATARLVGPGHATGFAIRFDKGGMDGSGKATLWPGPAAVPGVLYRLSDADLVTLDAYEGVGRGYARREIDILTPDGPARAYAYIADQPVEGLLPFDWYVALILAGALIHALPSDHLAMLAAVPHQPDPDLDRPGRIAALQALAAHGFDGPDAVLRAG